MSFKRKVKGMIKFILNNIPARKFDVRVVSLAPNELLKGRVALITGGTSGIGFHMAKAFLRSGAAVVITGRSEERLRLACGELNEDDHYKGRLFGLVMDNTRVDLFHDRFQKALDKVGSGGFPHIDILVNNAGVLGASMPNATEEAFDKVIDTNLKGVFLLASCDFRLYAFQVGNTRPDAWTCQEPCPLWCYGERDSARAYGHPDVVERWSR